MIPGARAAAMKRGAEAARDFRPRTDRDHRPRRRRVAMGDPQAPFAKVLEILDLHDLLGADGRLAPDVLLVSMGDHFDYGAKGGRDEAAESGERLVAWLASHAPDQVVMLAGNHDLARVGELARYDDRTWTRALAEAADIPDPKAPDPAAAAAWLGRHPDFPSVENGVLHLAPFRERQRGFVVELLRSGRLVLAHAPSRDLLLTHAGVGTDELDHLGVPGAARKDAAKVADRLNAALEAALAVLAPGRPFEVPGLYAPGSRAGGKGRGVAYHTPVNPDPGPAPTGPLPRTHFDPRRLPGGLVQVVGHVKDERCRKQLGAWCDPVPPRPGLLRHLVATGTRVEYRHGTPAPAPRAGQESPATMIFTDGGMNACPAEAYELLDLDRRTALARPGQA